MSTETTRPPRLPPPWFIHVAWKAHRALYKISGGRFLWTPANKRGWGVLRLTATGRKSGEDRSVLLGYIDDGPDLVVVAMNGWDEGEPAWWLNLQEHPDAVIRLKGQDPRPVRARKAAGEEHDRLWQHWVEVEPPLEAYAETRETESAVVVFEPRAETT
jgi:deazaflavin-dependent oxidoreductase (nitroreductase family)